MISEKELKTAIKTTLYYYRVRDFTITKKDGVLTVFYNNMPKNCKSELNIITKQSIKIIKNEQINS